MSRSFRLATAALGDGGFRHAPSASRVRIQGLRHTVERNGVGESRNVSFAAGSGATGVSFLVQEGEWLYQSPASYYSKRKAWDASPGYEQSVTLDFARPIPEECVLCHAGAANAIEGSLNRYASPAAPLTGFPCERCHGSGAAHADRPSTANIVNPARLEPVLRDSVCEQCHLNGEARILRPGKRWRDFEPGAQLEQTWTVFVRDDSGAGAIRVISHAEQLAASKCAQASSGKLWCGSCHSVHGASKRSATRDCQTCHAATAKAHFRQSTCAGCHMPKRPATDGGHTAYTDHRIERRPAPLAKASTPKSLRPWRAATGDQRSLGLAYIEAGDRHQSAELVQTGFAILAKEQERLRGDAAVLAALGYVLMQKQRPVEAARLLREAVTLAPNKVLWRLNLGLAQAAAEQRDAARATLRELLRIDPSVAAARSALSELR